MCTGGKPAARWLAVAVLALGCLAPGCGREARGPHLFLITSDALRADHTVLLGYPRETTPHLGALADEAWSFTQAVTLVPKTGPSFATHLTGLPPAEHRVTSNRLGLPERAPVLAEILAAHGYDTAAFVGNPVLSKRKGYDRGFDRYEEFGKTEGLDPQNAAFLRWAQARDWRRPTFVWIHYIDPHGPYTPPARYRDLFVGDALFAAEKRVVPTEYTVPEGWPENRVLGAVPAYQRLGDEGRVAWYVSQYDAEIRYMDDALGAVLAFLRERGLYADSGILFTSDHGESLGEHDYFFEHGWFVYDASLRVPLVVKPPGPVVARRVEAQASNLDTLPTLLSMAGIPPPRELGGRNLLRAGAAGPALIENPSTYPQRLVGVRTPTHKYVRELGSGAEELYDLAADAGERRNLAAAQPRETASLREELARLQGRLRPLDGEAPPVEPTREERELLARLGYADAEHPVRIVLVTLDTLRQDSFENGAGHAADMPHTRALAGGARVFRRHYSATSTTQPTHASLFTGLPPWQHGVHRNGLVLDAALETVVERMKARGFATGAVVASFPLHRRFGFDQGFDRYEDTFSVGERRRWSEVEIPGSRFYSQADEVTDEALRMLDESEGPKQFFWFHYFDAHQPYGDSPGGEGITLVELKRQLQLRVPGAAERVAEARRQYDRDVRYMDAALDRLFERLLADAERIETHIVVVSDHGESFGEGTALGHGESIPTEQIRVPLFLYSPRVQPGVVEAAVGSVDVAATLDALAGGSGLPGPGRDLSRGAEALGHQPVLGMRRTFARPIEDVRTDGSVRRVEGPLFYAVLGGREFRGDASHVEAGDALPVDPAERQQLLRAFGAFEHELEGRPGTELSDPETRAALEALGYLR